MLPILPILPILLIRTRYTYTHKIVLYRMFLKPEKVFS